MFIQFDYRILIGILSIGILFVVGMYIYTQRSVERFISEIGVNHTTTTLDKSIPETDTNPRSENSHGTLSPKSESANRIVKSKTAVESEATNTTEKMDASAEKTAKSEFDPTQLLSTLGLPEEVTTLFDEDADETDLEKVQDYLTENYGQSTEVEVIVNRLRQMSGGPVKLDDLISLFEEWIQVLPEGQKENQHQLMDVLTLLNQIKSNPTQVLKSTRLELYLGDEKINREDLEQKGYKITEIKIMDD